MKTYVIQTHLSDGYNNMSNIEFVTDDFKKALDYFNTWESGYYKCKLTHYKDSEFIFLYECENNNIKLLNERVQEKYSESEWKEHIKTF
jgi:hypothetical protein